MAKLHAYLNFNGNCEEAFNFYHTVFGGHEPTAHRFKNLPEDPNVKVKDADANKIMHTSLMVNDSVMLMGTDCVDSFGQKAMFGNSTYIMLDTETAEEARNLFSKLSANAQNLEMDLGEMFFAELFSSFTDQFGVAWMIYFEGNKKMDF